MYINELLLDIGWVSWYANHMRDIHDGRCPLPCDVTRNLSQVSPFDIVEGQLLALFPINAIE